jgi:hypothetical protein
MVLLPHFAISRMWPQNHERPDTRAGRPAEKRLTGSAHRLIVSSAHPGGY